MPAIRASFFASAIVALIAPFGGTAPARAEMISVVYTKHYAYRGIDDGFFTGTLLTGQDLFRVDLGQVVKKYIGETEKNLGLLFERIGDGAVVLLFDEADALFGKRTDVKDSHDRFAEDFIVLEEDGRRWSGLITLGPDDGVPEEGVYELSGRYDGLAITPIPEPAGLALLAVALVLLGAALLTRRDAAGASASRARLRLRLAGRHGDR